MLEPLLERFRHGDRLALSRLLSFLAQGQHTREILQRLEKPAATSRIVAITGSGGVGKSTLVGRLIELLRRQDQTVAVLACDPQSPVSGGALLGDRFRMPGTPDDGVFIRSLAAASGQGAVARNLEAMVHLLEAFGFAAILIETAGAGQGDTSVRLLADAVVLLLQPETGDELQWEKAGLLEVADIIAIHKADLPGADQAEAQVRGILGLSSAREVPVVRVSSRTGSGIEVLWKAIEACPLRHTAEAPRRDDLLLTAQQTLAQWLADSRKVPAVKSLLEEWEQGAIGKEEGVAALFRLLAGSP